MGPVEAMPPVQRDTRRAWLGLAWPGAQRDTRSSVGGDRRAHGGAGGISILYFYSSKGRTARCSQAWTPWRVACRIATFQGDVLSRFLLESWLRSILSRKGHARW
eukprot:UN1537